MVHQNFANQVKIVTGSLVSVMGKVAQLILPRKTNANKACNSETRSYDSKASESRKKREPKEKNAVQQHWNKQHIEQLGDYRYATFM